MTGSRASHRAVGSFRIISYSPVAHICRAQDDSWSGSEDKPAYQGCLFTGSERSIRSQQVTFASNQYKTWHRHVPYDVITLDCAIGRVCFRSSYVKWTQKHAPYHSSPGNDNIFNLSGLNSVMAKISTMKCRVNNHNLCMDA
jgi:hypothetical protein